MFRKLFVVLLLLAGLGFGLAAHFALTPVTPRELPHEFHISPGSSLKAVARQFEREGVLTAPLAFEWLARGLGRAGAIKAGGYLIERPLSPLELIDKITLGDTLQGRITLVEGWNFRQMRQAIAAQPRLRQDSREMSDAEILAAIGATETHPEGLFFPDTYYFDYGSSDLKLFARAYHAMRARLDAAWAGRVPGLPYRTPYEALIMASIIEKETGAPDERRLVASVFVNRMRIGMRLQTDPTVIYGLGEGFDGNLRRVDLTTDTPYNTYTRAGLPPTPIAMPGEASIRAALDPEQSRMLYFVAKGGGRHHFSATLEEHNRAVNRYIRGRP